MNNIIKHAEASPADVLPTRRDGQVVPVVEDDGRGFRPGGVGGRGC